MPRVVLHQPEIPPNTGNVARTCAATGSSLHLIHPLGFSLEDRHLRRAGLDYWPWVQLREHASWRAFISFRNAHPGRLLAFSRHSQRPYHEIAYRSDDWLLFGCESSGLPEELLAAADARLTIPMPGAVRAGGGVRSLNLSVAVGIVVFEALRQLSPAGPTGQGERGVT
ncbi:MAG: tRNA (cytidine(34)-2'-O)-methyltransferase [Cyanobacteriota bacterium]|nr:tRNA (cytidine(34)-2'-O)-methyltransferase [Cyanobacteriota bacterium]